MIKPPSNVLEHAASAASLILTSYVDGDNELKLPRTCQVVPPFIVYSYVPPPPDADVIVIVPLPLPKQLTSVELSVAVGFVFTVIFKILAALVPQPFVAVTLKVPLVAEDPKSKVTEFEDPLIITSDPV